MAPHSSILAQKISWTEEPGRLQSMESRRVGPDWATSLSLFTFLHWRRKWQPTPVFVPGESQGRGSLVGCSLWGRTELDTTERLHFHFSLSSIGEGNGNPLQCSCLENARDGGAWWAVVYGVTQSRIWLKWLSSSSSILVFLGAFIFFPWMSYFWKIKLWISSLISQGPSVVSSLMKLGNLESQTLSCDFILRLYTLLKVRQREREL